MTFCFKTNEATISVTTDNYYKITKTPKKYSDFIGQKVGFLTSVLRRQTGFSWKKVQ